MRRVVYSLLLVAAFALVGGFFGQLLYGQMNSGQNATVTVTAVPGITTTGGGGRKVITEGRFKQPIVLYSADGRVMLAFPKGTVALDAKGGPLVGTDIAEEGGEYIVKVGRLYIRELEDPPPPPPASRLVGLVYDAGPNGSTFNPPIVITFNYDDSFVPPQVREEDMGIVWWDAARGEWIELQDCVVDPELNIITAPVSHFTPFSIVARLRPATFVYDSDLRIVPSEAEVGQMVTISVLVANTGEEEGSYTVTFNINGVVEETREITLAGGASESVTFTTAKDEAGTYSVDVDGLTGSFTVREVAVPPPVVAPPPGINWAMWGPVIGVAVFLAIFLPIRWRRRRFG